MSSLRLATVALFVGTCSAFHAPSPIPHLRASSSSFLSASSSSPPAASARLATRVLRRGGLDLSMAGVEREVLREGDGKTFPQKGDLLTVHYEGTLARGGTKFDSSYDFGEPIQFTIGEGQVIKGWDQGLMDMSLGEKVKLDIAPFFGYGPQGSPPDIPPMSPLVFIVELLAINDNKMA